MPSNYTKQTWVNSGASGGLNDTDEVNAERMGHIEDGIEAAAQDATTTVKGIARFADNDTTIAGTSTDRATTPAGVDAKVANALANVSTQGHQHIMEDITDFEVFRLANNIPKIQTYDSGNAESPGAVGQGVLWLDIVTSPTSSPSIDYVTHNQDSTNAASWTFTPENLLNTFNTHDYFIAFVHTGHATVNPTNDADSMTGGGMTWAAEGTAVSQGIITTQVFRTTGGTPDGTNLVVNATGGTEGCAIQVVAVRDLTYDETFKAAGGGGSTGSVTATGATANQRIIAAVAFNSSSQTVTSDPGTPLGGTPDVTMASPSIRSRASVMNPAATTVSYTLSGSSNKTVCAVLVGAP
jgi:hypothetical protein